MRISKMKENEVPDMMDIVIKINEIIEYIEDNGD